MGDSDPPFLVSLDPGDEKEAMALSIEAGWNQVEADWLHFITRGRAIGLRCENGRLIASAAALPYKGPFGFVGMVIVTQDWRRRGLATKLVEICKATLRDMDRIAVLDATEQGEPVYAQQGFVPQFRFDRWETAGSATEPAHDGDQARLERIVTLDAAAFGASRPDLMADFANRSDTVTIAAGRDSFAMLRRGRRAWQGGPVVAPNETRAIELLERLFQADVPAFIDVPKRWSSIGAWLSDRGCAIQRSFARMALDRSEPFGDPARLFAVAGPEFG